MAGAGDSTRGRSAATIAGDAVVVDGGVRADGRGLRVDRFFTRDGAHPYDELTWERRDAVLTNWRDGSVAFEQRDVEFPSTWSMTATTIVAQKYFRGELGTPERESSVRQMVDRVADTITDWGRGGGYFADERSAQVFNEELKHLLVNQKAAFNSPVWFNVGVDGTDPQCSACFILSVDDTMDSILNWYREEGIIFKGGSGAGVNISSIRSAKETMTGGGHPSGPVSFMRGADASAGTIRSGGKTRRAAKMVILDVDHPDIEDFIWCKANEEKKARALRDAGFDVDLGGADSYSLQYQNANNSVRVTDAFMRAYDADDEYELRAVKDGQVLDRKRARDVMRQIAEAAWDCADPGIQYDTTINHWHTCPESGRINGSNPCCFVGETLVETVEGPMRIDLLEKAAAAGQPLPKVAGYDVETGEHVDVQVLDAWVAGETTHIVEVETTQGLRLRCTPDHRFLTCQGDYVEAQDLEWGIALRGVDDVGDDCCDEVRRVTHITLPEPVEVYDIEVERTHNFAVTDPSGLVDTAVVVHNSEYMHLDNSACNLASLNLMTFLDDAGRFDVVAYRRAVEVVFLAQDILVDNSSYPTERIGANARAYRQLGLGYTNLGGLLMSLGLPYDSEEGRALASAVTAVLTGHAYRTSAVIAAAMGPFAGYAPNAEAMQRVMQQHRDALADVDAALVPDGLYAAAVEDWDQSLGLGALHGFRNAQATVAAPTGTISFLMDSDTTGVEPDLGLVKTKKLVSGGSIQIVNRLVPRALRRLGYGDEQVSAITAHIEEHHTVVGAPGLKDEHLPVFATAMGDNTISPMGHVTMMAAIQPWLSGAISKCIVGESLVTTEDGLVRIGSLYGGEAPGEFREMRMQVASRIGFEKTSDFFYAGLQPTIEVRLRSGHRIVGTPQHRVLVAQEGGPAWLRLSELTGHESIAIRVGADLWAAVPPAFDDFRPSPAYGSQLPVEIPAEMTEDLALFLGAYASEGHTTRSNWSVIITNADEEVLARLRDIARTTFGIDAKVRRQPGKCPGLVLSSKTLVEFLEHLGAGERASAKRIPDAVLRSPREMVVAFLRGLALDAYVKTPGKSLAWAICLDSPELLDDLQAVLTNLGIRSGRITKYNREYDKSFDEVYVSGWEARRLLKIVPFLEGDKSARAQQALTALPSENDPWDVIPGVDGASLFASLPREGKALDGRPLRIVYGHLRDPRTKSVSRATVCRLASEPEVQLPDWLQDLIDGDLHFSPIADLGPAGMREVFDLSVPGSHSFVANGIVNHNTVNVPEETTVEEIEEIYVEGWRRGLKALAVYRDNCKVGQPLSVTKKDAGEVPAASAETAAEDHPPMVRRKLPKQRPSQTISFAIGDAKGYVTAGEYPGDGLGEIFVKLGKQGSTLSGMMDAFAISVSLGLQYGVPLEAYVEKFMNMRFEPAGLTDDPEIRFATSIVDYLSRRLAIEYLPADHRQALGIYTLAERSSMLDEAEAPTLPTLEEPDEPRASAQPSDAQVPLPFNVDAPLCYSCGVQMKRAGSCHVCEQCGSTSGCS